MLTLLFFQCLIFNTAKRVATKNSTITNQDNSGTVGDGLGLVVGIVDVTDGVAVGVGEGLVVGSAASGLGIACGLGAAKNGS